MCVVLGGRVFDNTMQQHGRSGQKINMETAVVPYIYQKRKHVGNLSSLVDLEPYCIFLDIHGHELTVEN